MFYPQYCFDCMFPFVTEMRNARCRFCNGENVINCYGEKFEEIQKRNREKKNGFTFGTCDKK